MEQTQSESDNSNNQVQEQDRRALAYICVCVRAWTTAKSTYSTKSPTMSSRGNQMKPMIVLFGAGSHAEIGSRVLPLRCSVLESMLLIVSSVYSYVSLSLCVCIYVDQYRIQHSGAASTPRRSLSSFSGVSNSSS